MGRKRRLSHFVLIPFAIMMIQACSRERMEAHDDMTGHVAISLRCTSSETRALIPEENMINDINLILFENGKAETVVWKDGISASGRTDMEISFIKGRRYTVFVLANMGRKTVVTDTSDIKDLVMELSDMNGFGNGIPMSALLENISFDNQKTIDIEMIRMAAKISLSIDRSRLSKDVDLKVAEVRIGNCPKSVKVIGPSRVTSIYDCYETGFNLTPEQCMPLNETGAGGISGEVPVYMLENMQGPFPDRISDDEEKILDSSNPLYDLCSYLEMEIDYSSSELISYDSPLIYRFYLGDGLRSLDIERNCHYHITVIPEDDGLSGGGWRVDKSGIGPSTPLFKMHPGNYIEGNAGDTLRVWCECYPRTAPFDPGYEELAYDKSRGIYDYSVDNDGHGVTLYLKKAGTGIVYMSAGEPINRSGMVIVYVKP